MYSLSERLVERKREARGCNQKSTILVGVPQLRAGLSSIQPPQTQQHEVEMPLGVLAALTGSAGPACPTLGGCRPLNPFWDGNWGFKKKKKRKQKRKKKKQKPTILSTSLTTLNAAALGDVVHGSWRARGLWAGPIRYLNRSRQGGPSGRQPKWPRSPRDQDTSSCDCPGALFSWRWSWSSPHRCPGFACFPARPSRSRCCSSSPGRPWDSLCSRRPRRSLLWGRDRPWWGPALGKTSSAVGPNRWGTRRRAPAGHTPWLLQVRGLLGPPSARVEGGGGGGGSPLSESERSEETVEPVLSVRILSMPSFSSCLFRCRCSRCSWSIWWMAFLSQSSSFCGSKGQLLKGAGTFHNRWWPCTSLPRGEICQFPTEAVCRVPCWASCGDSELTGWWPRLHLPLSPSTALWNLHCCVDSGLSWRTGTRPPQLQQWKDRGGHPQPGLPCLWWRLPQHLLSEQLCVTEA